MRPVELTGIVNRTPDYAQLKQNEDQKPVIEQTAFQTQFNKQVERNSDTVVKNMILNGRMRSLMPRKREKTSISAVRERKKKTKGRMINQSRADIHRLMLESDISFTEL